MFSSDKLLLDDRLNAFFSLTALLNDSITLHLDLYLSSTYNTLLWQLTCLSRDWILASAFSRAWYSSSLSVSESEDPLLLNLSWSYNNNYSTITALYCYIPYLPYILSTLYCYQFFIIFVALLLYLWGYYVVSLVQYIIFVAVHVLCHICGGIMLYTGI